ncbi:MAG: c-type cytochrome, partial [Alphaproteobacteria bacterium]
MLEKLKGKIGPLVIGAVLVGGLILMITGRSNNSGQAGPVIIPEFSQVAQAGKVLFDENCAACHGENAAGSENGPSFLNQIYRPGHHANGAFVVAATNGVRAHHWRFGNMPPVEGIKPDDVIKIVHY